MHSRSNPKNNYRPADEPGRETVPVTAAECSHVPVSVAVPLGGAVEDSHVSVAVAALLGENECTVGGEQSYASVAVPQSEAAEHSHVLVSVAVLRRKVVVVAKYTQDMLLCATCCRSPWVADAPALAWIPAPG